MGQTYVHVPTTLSKVAALGQDVQLVAAPLLHAKHDSSQTWQAL